MTFKKFPASVFPYSFSLFSFFYIIFLFSCNNDYQPKPKGFFRIDMPEKTYLKFDSAFPFSFEYPDYAIIRPDIEKNSEPFWLNIVFPRFNGTLHISYKQIINNSSKHASSCLGDKNNNSLNVFLEDSRTLVFKHIPKASAIEENIIHDDENKVYGMIFNISGSGAASPCQFYLTDSTKHFLRAALYFNFKPNNDSIAPVIDFIRQDIMHLIKSFRFKYPHNY